MLGHLFYIGVVIKSQVIEEKDLENVFRIKFLKGNFEYATLKSAGSSWRCDKETVTYSHLYKTIWSSEDLMAAQRQHTGELRTASQ